MEIFLFISLVLLALSCLCNTFLILFLFKSYNTIKLLLKKLSTYDQLQDADISSLKSRLDDYDKRLMSLFVE